MCVFMIQSNKSILGALSPGVLRRLREKICACTDCGGSFGTSAIMMQAGQPVHIRNNKGELLCIGLLLTRTALHPEERFQVSDSAVAFGTRFVQ